MTALRCCCGIFDDRELVRCYARGLLPQIRERGLEGIGQPMHEKSDLTAVVRLASSEGNTYRACRPPTQRPVRTPPTRTLLSIEKVPSRDDYEPSDDDPPLMYDPTFSTQVREALESVQTIQVARNF